MAKTTMTLEEVITKVDNLKPNAFSNEQKTDWINKVETMLQTEVMDIPEDAMIVYNYEEDHDTELIVRLPYSDVYEWWLKARIDFEAGDVRSYRNNIGAFNEAYNSCQKALRKQNKSDTHFRNWW